MEPEPSREIKLLQNYFWSTAELFKIFVFKSAAVMWSIQQSLQKRLQKMISRNIALQIRDNSAVNVLKILCKLKYILGTRLPGYTTISRSVCPDNYKYHIYLLISLQFYENILV